MMGMYPFRGENREIEGILELLKMEIHPCIRVRMKSLVMVVG